MTLRHSTRGRSFGAGSAGVRAAARPATRRPVRGLVVAVLALAVAGGLAGCGRGSGSASPTADATYGGDPTFLPSNTLHGGFGHRVVDASAQHPALATQGDTVRVHIGTASVLATVAGPEVPVAGQQYQAPDSPATWTVVLTGATHAIPVQPATFQAIDETGNVHDLVPQGRVPHVLQPHQTARFRLFSPGFETGEGRMRWIPRGHLAPVEWDFTVETD